MSLLVYNTFSKAAFSSGDLNVAASFLYKSLNCFNASLDCVTVTSLSGTDKGMTCSIRARLWSQYIIPQCRSGRSITQCKGGRSGNRGGSTVQRWKQYPAVQRWKQYPAMQRWKQNPTVQWWKQKLKEHYQGCSSLWVLLPSFWGVPL